MSPGFGAEQLLTFTASVPTAVYATPQRSRSSRTPPDSSKPSRRTARDDDDDVPVTGRGGGAWFNIVDRPVPPNTTPPGVPNRFVRANYFQVMGIPIRQGPRVRRRRSPGGARSVIISESVARRFFANEDPIGRHIFMGAPDNRVVARIGDRRRRGGRQADWPGRGGDPKRSISRT